MRKKIIRIITYSDDRAHTSLLFQQLSFLHLDKINDEAIALLTFNYFYGLLPVAFEDFKLNMELHSHNTRSSSKNP